MRYSELKSGDSNFEMDSSHVATYAQVPLTIIANNAIREIN